MKSAFIVVVGVAILGISLNGWTDADHLLITPQSPQEASTLSGDHQTIDNDGDNDSHDPGNGGKRGTLNERGENADVNGMDGHDESSKDKTSADDPRSADALPIPRAGFRAPLIEPDARGSRADGSPTDNKGDVGPAKSLPINRTKSSLTSHVFSDQLDEGYDSEYHTFTVPSGTDYILVTLAMIEDRDFDLSLWDDQGNRTGGWTSTQPSNSYDIPKSEYSGWPNYGHRIREWITVKPPETWGTWRVRCYSYHGDSTYTIRVEVRDGYGEEGKELGIEWINDYPGSDDDLKHSDNSAKDFRDKLESVGWTKEYEWSNSSVWERDFKSKLYLTGGYYNEEVVTDKVDIALYAGHGRRGNPWDDDAQMSYDGGGLSLSNASHDDAGVYPHDAYLSWGDQDLEWIGFDCCHALSSPWEWAQAMNGLHLICGFSSKSYQDCLFGDANNMGRAWADCMIDDVPDVWPFWDFDDEKTIKQSWFWAADQVLDFICFLNGTCVTARVIGENKACGNDYLWGQGSVTSDPVHDNIYETWDHKVGRCCPAPSYHPIDGDSIVLQRVVPKFITEDTVAAIGAIFGLTGGVHCDTIQGVVHYHMAQNGSTLVVSEEGGIDFMDGTKLWLDTIPPDLPTINETESIAVAFLNDNGLMPLDASFFDVVSDSQTTAYSVIDTYTVRPPKTEMQEEDHIIEAFATNHHVHFEREIDGYPVSSQLTVYIGENGEIVGFRKMWRAVTPDVSAPLIPVGDAKDLLYTYGSRFAVSPPPYADSITIIDSSLAYYEFCDGVHQEYLMPVYVFDAEIFVDAAVDSERIAVPAVEMFVPPIPSITSPGDGDTFTLGDTITFAGTVPYGGTPPYNYLWNSDIEGDLGGGPFIVVSSLSPGEHTITLTVTDSGLISGKTVLIGIHIFDPFEPNDTAETATAFGCGDTLPAPSLTFTIHKNGDVDWFTFTIDETTTVQLLDIDARSLDPPSLLNATMALYDAALDLIVRVDGDPRSGEDPWFRRSLTPGDYYLQVASEDGSAGPYRLETSCGDIELLSLKVRNVGVYAGEQGVRVPVCLTIEDPEIEIDDWEILLSYDLNVGTVVGVDQYGCGDDSIYVNDPGEYIKPLFHDGGYEPEYFNYIINDTLGWVKVVGKMDMDYPEDDTPALKGVENEILFSVVVDVKPACDSLDMSFCWMFNGCTDNIFNAAASTPWGPRADSRPPELECDYDSSKTDVVKLYGYPCSSGLSIQPVYPSDRGDINCDCVPYSVADAMMFINYLVYGDDALRDGGGDYYCGSFEAHCYAADIDGDGFCFTISDLITLIRIINGYGLPSKVSPSDLVVTVSRGVVAVDGEIGAARFVFAGEGEVRGDDVLYAHRNGRTIVLVYTLEDRALRGELFTIVGDVALESVEAADFHGGPVTVKTAAALQEPPPWLRPSPTRSNKTPR